MITTTFKLFKLIIITIQLYFLVFLNFLGLVVSNELTNTNVLIQDVFTLLFQVSAG